MLEHLPGDELRIDVRTMLETAEFPESRSQSFRNAQRVLVGDDEPSTEMLLSSMGDDLEVASPATSGRPSIVWRPAS
jgi:hypothetical protein